VSVVANVAINLDARGVSTQLAAIRQTSIGAANGFKNLEARAQAVKSIVEAQQGSFAKASTVQGVFAAKVKNTEFAIKSQIAALRDVQSKVQLNGALYKKAAEQIAQYEAVLKSANNEEQKGAGIRDNLASTIGKLAIAFAGIQAAKFVFVKAAELESQTRSLQVLTGSAEKAKQIIQELQQLGAVTPFTSTELIDSAKRLQAFGVEADKVVETTRRLADVSGATGAELSGLVTAYGQVQAKGRLQGEELLQFQERGVALQAELRKMYGLSGEEFQKALEKGRIGAEAVEVAILRLTSAGGKYANGAIAQSDTLQGKLSTLQDSFEQLARNIGTFFTPVFKFLIDGIDAFLQRLNNAQRLGAEARAYQEANVRTRNRFGLRAANPFDTEVSQYRERLRRSLVTSEMGAGRGAAPSTPTPSMVPALLGGSGGSGGGKGAAEKAAREAERALEIQKQQLKAADDQNFAIKNRLAILQEVESVANRQLQLDVRLDEIAKEYGEKRANVKSNDELILINANEILEKKYAELEAERELNELLIQRARLVADVVRASSMPTVYNELETQDAALKDILDKYPAIGAAADAAATLATSGMSEMIAGTKSAQEVFAEFLNTIANALMQTAAKMIAQYIAIGIARMFAGMGGGGGDFAPSGSLPSAGFVGPSTNFAGISGPLPDWSFNAKGNAFGANGIIPFAKGGIVNGPTLFPFANGTGLMGEAGPEAIMPLQRGANGKLGVLASGGGGNVSVVVNVDASGSNVEGDAEDSKQLGRVIAAAIQQELVKQKRPGGLLA
jgi:tape measure domain-containing protein